MRIFRSAINPSFRSIYTSLFIATTAAMIGVGIIQPVMPLYARGMGASGFTLGLIFALFAVSRGLFAPIVGEYSDRIGRRRIMLVGLALSAVFSLSYVWVESPLVLLLVRFLHGGTSALVTPVAQSYVGDIVPEGQEGKYVNLFFMSMFGGQAIGPIVGGMLFDNFNIDAPFYALSALLLVSLLLVFWLVPETHFPDRSAAGAAAKKSFLRSFAAVLRDRPMLAVLAQMATRAFYRWGFVAFFPILATSRLDLSPTSIGFILSFYMLGSTLLQYPAGILNDRFPHRQRDFVVWGCVLSAALMFIIPWTTNFYGLMLLMLLMGLLTAISRAGAIVIRTQRGRVLGMGIVTGAFTTSLSVGEVLGPLSFGLIMDVASIDVAFVVGGVVGIIGGLLSFRLLKNPAPQNEAGQ